MTEIPRPEQRRTKLVAEWDEETGRLTRCDFVEMTPEECEQLPTLPEPVNRGFDLGLSEEAKKDPNFRVMASEVSLWGLTNTRHVFGEE